MAERNEESAELEGVLQQLAKDRGDSYAGLLSSIIFTNFEKGRIKKRSDNGVGLSMAEYVALVVDKYDQYQPYLKLLQIEKSDDDWQELYEKLRKWAYSFLLKKGFYRGDGTSEIADGCASDAAAAIFTTSFPYDVDFMPWAHVILQNVCRRYIRENTRVSQVPLSEQVELQDELDQSHVLFSFEGRYDQEVRRTFLNAIEQLSQESWKEVLILRFFYNLSPAEIAEILNKTPSAVYNLQFKAINALREIWN